ncbi:MAG: DHA2 family efflux MFS transporter permease subunit [Candidatus Omnitrophica bacterium]|nr:DHA2 family efflux MFS transporter permease subunit [Candidatus Omnitrophota bacterium]
MSSSVDKSHLTPSKWIVALSVMIGAFMGVMDMSVVNVALPHMMGTFGENMSAITWVATAYSIAAVIMLTMAGWWSTLMGRKNFYLASLAIFTIGSILAGMSHTFPEMIACRILQGMGGGSLVPLAQAIIRETFPSKEQGMAMAIFSMGVVVAPAIGPVFGGWLTDHYGWAWIFYINIPFSLVAALMVNAFVHDPPYLRRGIKKIDIVGIVLLTVGLAGLQVFLERGQQENWFESTWMIWTAVFTAVSLLSLVVWELSVAEPIVNFRIFKNAQFRMGVAVVLVFGVALYGTTFILPQFTQRLLNYPAYQAGLVLMPRAIALMCVLPIVGKLYNIVDPRKLMIFGIGVVCISYFQLAHLATSAGQGNIMPMLLLMGTGMPFIFISLSTLSLNSLEKEHVTSASGLFNLFQQVGGNIGYALMATLLERNTQIHHATLSEHITLFDRNCVAFFNQTVAFFHHQGMSLGQAKDAALAMVNRLVTQQAEMMAYNDISIFLMFLFICCVPLVLMIPIPKVRFEPTAPIEM